MTPAGQAAYGATYTAIAQQYQSAAGMTPAGLRAYGDTYQSMGVSYLTAQQDAGVPTQWHDIFTGAGVTLVAIVLVGGATYLTRNHHHGHHGRPTLAH